MSFNPVRAANFYKRKGPRHTLNPHAGTKHSDIVRRQGLGITVPMANRLPTLSGFGAVLGAFDGFVVRSEVIGAGNNLGYGFNDKADRLIIVRQGYLFVRAEASESIRLQAGDFFKFPKGMKYAIGSGGTEDVEVLFIEDPGYANGWTSLQAPETREITDMHLAGAPPSEPTMNVPRRTDQSLAKSQAAAAAHQKVRRRPSRPDAPRGEAGPAPGTKTISGAVAVGRNLAPNPNSTNVVGVNPRPAGAGAFSED